MTERPIQVNMTMEAPEWAWIGGFPEDMPFTDSADVPEGAECVQDWVADAVSGKECAIFQKDDQTYKVELESNT
jgi:hypothetical protein